MRVISAQKYRDTKLRRRKYTFCRSAWPSVFVYVAPRLRMEKLLADGCVLARAYGVSSDVLRIGNGVCQRLLLWLIGTQQQFKGQIELIDEELGFEDWEIPDEDDPLYKPEEQAFDFPEHYHADLEESKGSFVERHNPILNSRS